ncbi:hypothetical protein FOFC_03070 [Fusarium oxysporum]|nr:hypothetical protein FOFC_02473 [Fusarium oxysporum]KAI8416757.1 hypothetical protein FOFC_03070 [Fusarium oxysporum]
MTLEERSINVPSDKSSASPKRPKRGPAVTPIQERPYKARKPVLRKEETHPKARRRDVVMFLYHHLIYDPDSWKSVNGYRKPFQREAATYFQVPISTISDWWRHDIINLEREKRSYSPQWPLLEKQLFQEFIQRRAQQEVITTGWFRRRATEIFRESVTDQSLVKLFTFSNGWWIGFKRRFNIIKRRVTKRATRQPEEFKEICGSFWWLREEMELYEAEEARKRKTEWSVSDKRVMTTWIVARAFERLKNNRDMISKAFLEAGITVRPDGSQDNLIRIKGIDDIDFKGWEEAGDISIQSEELVHRLCDGEELGFGPEGDFTLNTLNYALERLKLAQLQQMATLNKISVKGNKSDIRDRLVQYFTREGPKKEAITVENGLKDVIFVAS